MGVLDNNSIIVITLVITRKRKLVIKETTFIRGVHFDCDSILKVASELVS